MSSLNLSVILNRLLFLWLFHVIRITFEFFQSLFWKINGTEKQLNDSKLSNSSSKPIQVLDILYQYRLDSLQRVSTTQFLLKHNRFESSKYVTNSDNVTLLTLEEDVAIFVENVQGKEIWRSKYGTHLRLAQLDNAVRLLFVPMKTFLKMTEDLDTRRRPVVYLASPARCGSTVLMQTLEMTERCVTIGQSDVMHALSQLVNKHGATPQMKMIVRASVRWLCRPYQNFQPDLYVISVPNLSSSLSNLLKDSSPSCKFLFMYRNIEKSSRSFCRVIQEFPLLSLACTLGCRSSYMRGLVMSGLGLPETDVRMSVGDDLDWGAYLWIQLCVQYTRLRKDGFDVSAVRYEDLLASRRQALTAILKYCGLTTALTDNATRGLELDSQRNSMLSRSVLNKHKTPGMNEAKRKKLNKILERHWLPSLDGDGVIQGTITTRQLI